MREANFFELIGQTPWKIEGEVGDDTVTFYCTTGKVFEMRHDQDCCESVYLEDVVGDLDSLLHKVIVQATEDTKIEGDLPPINPNDEYADDSYTWTFYHIRTMETTVTLRWYGSSNGYYSEEVSFYLLDEPVYQPVAAKKVETKSVRVLKLKA